jgi:hypothetical protein
MALRAAVIFCFVWTSPFLPLAAQARLTRGPYLQALVDTSVEVVWLTDVPSTGAVRWHEEGGQDAVAAESTPGAAHRVKLAGLKPGLIHGYQVLDGNSLLADETFRFRTSPPIGAGEIRVVVAGDSGDGSDDQLAVAALIRGLEPDIFVHTGDYDYEAGDLDRSVFGPYRDVISRACFYPSRGNHDIRVKWRDVFFPPNAPETGDAMYYSFDWGSAHFAAFDTNFDGLTGGAQLRWLEADLERAKSAGAKWLVLFFHEPPYTVGGYALFLRAAHEVIPPIADRFGVDLVLSGHDHNYQRSHPVRGEVVHDAWQSPAFVSPRGTIYLVSGGGGRQLYPEVLSSDHRFTRLFIYEHHALELVITPAEIRVKARSPTKEVLDEFTITKDRPRPAYGFMRGDADLTGSLNLTDPIHILGQLFLGAAPECPFAGNVASDANGSGSVEITDAIYLLGYLFRGSPPPPAPFPECETAPDADEAWCTRGCVR